MAESEAPVVTLSAEQRTAFETEAKEGETVDHVLQATVDEQTTILRADQANAWWNSNTLAEKEAIKAANQ